MLSLWFGAFLIVVSTVGAAFSTTVSEVCVPHIVEDQVDNTFTASAADCDARCLVRPGRVLHIRAKHGSHRRLVRREKDTSKWHFVSFQKT
jgi:hypothetical protein